MKIARLEAHHLANIPIQPPPFRKLPNAEHALIVEIETTDGLIGYSMGGYTHPVVVDFLNHHAADLLVGEDASCIERVIARFDRHSVVRFMGRAYLSALALVDIALWDLKGKSLGVPVHKLLGGAPVYSVEELAAEAKHLAELGNLHLKNTVGRQAVPNPADDYLRMRAMREAVGPRVKLAMDGNSRMTVAQATKLCQMTEELDISFIEEPVIDNHPTQLRELRGKTSIPIAAAENHKYSARDLLVNDAVDILQPNVTNDGGYTAGLRIGMLAQAFGRSLGHGNGSGPHNIALQAALSNGGLVEYHFHKWMAYNAIFENVPQPENGYLQVSQEPGLGLNPKRGLIKEFKKVDRTSLLFSQPGAM
ncbi:mandelate racemase/muconate lactonizing enzyme family protein [Paraburkholderia sp. BL21I4N1]|uniref:mandelate racemase/muconate lactonizing enzyme family protein n=1 Tax=Paraburkholderia sp. BL21I4N1 TaxID=1938801 RepID=UPI000CFDE854|nr:mandelate racemase/muconate lactonizing enzyme family protein [Paraburkholderia sp. BL21I4N1]PQV54641.1 L-alanine-DL-glutamate epimerase-like enolase superfamily enzyme [Paraburkholderia sp. BL21I4N1]